MKTDIQPGWYLVHVGKEHNNYYHIMLLFMFAMIIFTIGVMLGHITVPLPPHLNCVSSWSANVLTIVCS